MIVLGCDHLDIGLIFGGDGWEGEDVQEKLFENRC